MYEELVASVQRLTREAEYLEQHLVKALNSACVQGAKAARKASPASTREWEGWRDA
jgi:hypothetical protein